MDRVTILRPLGKQLLAKAFTIAPTGQVVKRDWSDVARYRVEQAEVASVHDLLRMLRQIEPDARACVIRGEPVDGTNLADTRRKKFENGGAFADVPRHWIMLDLDKVKLPAGANVIDDPADAARVIVDLIAAHVPELDGVTAIVQFSSSAGIEDLAEAEAAAGLPARWDGVVKRGAGVGAHVWYWLNTPANGVELDRWAKAANAAIGHGFIDPATLRTVQPHYTAGPVFGSPLRDPLTGRRTLLIEGEVDAATLVIPDVAARPAYEPGSRSSGGGGYLGALNAIGGPEGFNTPIMRAVANYVATNWPSPNAEALIDDIMARVLSADPGGRSPADIERYADRGRLAARIKWAMEREEANRAAKAEAAAAAAETPTAPTYPDRGVPLAEANRLAAEAIARFSARIAAGEFPQLLVKVTVGGGKTFAAIDLLPDLRAAGKAAGRGPVLFTHPRHALGDQIAADILARHPAMKVAVYRGMDADDPATPGKKMCQDRTLPAAARAAGQSATHGCKVCPLRCSYLDQAEQMRTADVIVAPHQVHFLTPFAGWPRITVDGKKVPVPPSAVIVDEDVTGAGIAGLDPRNPVQLALSALQSEETPNITGADRERLLYLRRQVLEALTSQPAGPLFRTPLEWMGIEPPYLGSMIPARELARLEWDTKPRVKLGKGATRADALAAYQAAAEQGFTRLRPLLAETIADFLTTGDARSVNLTLEPEAELGRSQGTGPAVQFAWRQEFHEAWAAPLLFLDATGRPEILQHWAPRLEVVEIEVQAPHQRVVQAADREFSRTMLTTEGNAKRLVDLIMVETATAGGAVLVVAQMAVVRLLRPLMEARGGARDPCPEDDEDAPATYRFPSGTVLHLAHHGDITGSNAWKDAATVIVVGRPATNRLAGERLAEVIAGRAVAIAADTDKSHWPTVAAGIRMADGTGRLIDQQPQHPDPLVEAGRWAVTEGAVLQAIGRPRGVRRTADRPVRVLLLNRLALPLTVAEVTTWEAILPDRLTVAAAEAALFVRALPLAAADLHTARPDLWETVRAAERFLEDRAKSKTPQSLIRDTYKGLGGLRTLRGARYRKGRARVWSNALVPLADGEAALEAAVREPLIVYEEVPSEDGRQARQPTPKTGAETSPPPAWWDATPAAASVTALHPPLPGEDHGQAVRPPPQSGLLGVIVAAPAPIDSAPEPGSFEPEDAAPAVDEVPMPAKAPAAWRAELARRLAADPPPRMWGDHTDQVRLLVWHERQDAARAAWEVEWRAAWEAGQHLPAVRNGT